MDAGTAQVASAVAMLVRTTLLPASCGAMAAPVLVSRLPGTSRGAYAASSQSVRADRLRAPVASDRLTVVGSRGTLAPRLLAGASLPSSRTSASTCRQLAAVCTIASPVVRAVAIPHHATENHAFGVFFLLSAFAQLGWGVGAWDVAAQVWELGALACCLQLLLASGGPTRTRGTGGSSRARRRRTS